MTKDTFFKKKLTINVQGKLLDLSVPKVMGILNITPDSFYQRSRTQDEVELVKKAELMLQEGADILDLGAYSSRPGAIDISAEEERSRLIPAVRHLKNIFPEVIISVDTFRADVAAAAIDVGAGIINDISGGQSDDRMFEIAGKSQVPYILMHMKGTPQNMTQLNQYKDLLGDITWYFSRQIRELKDKGVKDIILDPGFGFAKNINQNLYLLKHMKYLECLGLPILAGLSRKSTIWRTLNTTADKALNGTTFLNAFALQNGANILRVHDVKEAKECIELYRAYYESNV